jgi:hypothetical protein
MAAGAARGQQNQGRSGHRGKLCKQPDGFVTSFLAMTKNCYFPQGQA